MAFLTIPSLVLITVAWLFAWRAGYRWCRCCGVTERASLWVLACIPPTAGLLFAVQLIALISLLSRTAIVTPAAVAVVFLATAWVVDRMVRRIAYRHGTHLIAPPIEQLPRFGVWWTPLLIVAVVYGVFLVDALTRFPTGYDGLHYHLPSAVRWMQTRRLDLLVGLNHQSFPENGMIVPFLLCFGGLERLFNVVHLPEALAVGLATFGLTRAIGASHRGAMVGACVALSVPMVLFQSFSSYIDLYGAAAWLAGLLALTWAARAEDRQGRYGMILLAGLSAGVALGSKTTFLVLVPLLGLVAMVTEWIHRNGETRRPPKPVGIAVLFSVACLVGSFGWFARGAIQAGNPVYPLAVRIGGTQILPGFTADRYFPKRSAARKLGRWWDYPWRETKHSGTGYPYSRNNGLGAAYAAFVPVGMLMVIVSGGLARYREPAEAWRIIHMLLAAGGVVILLTIFHETLRFVLPLLLAAVPIGALIAGRLARRFPRSILALLIVALTVTGAVAALKPVHALAGRIRDGVWARSDFYEIPAVIDDLAPGSRILNLSAVSMTYPLIGRNLDKEVITRVHWDLLLAGEPMSARALVDNKIDYIYLREPWPDDWPQEWLQDWSDEWSDDLSLELAYNDAEEAWPLPGPARRLYRVRPRQP